MSGTWTLDAIQHSGVQRLVQELVRRVQPKKVVLFGSRAAGKARKTSDFDFAVYFDSIQSEAFSRFVVDADETLETLLKIDWVNAAQCSNEMSQSILTTGITIYEAT
jgi:predicted nucleotidyltransferase